MVSVGKWTRREFDDGSGHEWWTRQIGNAEWAVERVYDGWNGWIVVDEEAELIAHRKHKRVYATAEAAKRAADRFALAEAESIVRALRKDDAATRGSRVRARGGRVRKTSARVKE